MGHRNSKFESKSEMTSQRNNIYGKKLEKCQVSYDDSGSWDNKGKCTENQEVTACHSGRTKKCRKKRETR